MYEGELLMAQRDPGELLHCSDKAIIAIITTTTGADGICGGVAVALHFFALSHFRSFTLAISISVSVSFQPWRTVCSYGTVLQFHASATVNVGCSC